VLVNTDGGVQVVRVLNNITWKPIAELEHAAKITDDATVAFEEVTDDTVDPSDAAEQCSAALNAPGSTATAARRKYTICNMPVEVRL
jgi:GTP cyclohydrolase III